MKSGERKTRKYMVSWFGIRNDLLYRYFQNRGKDQDKFEKQLVVPKSYRSTVLNLAHESILGGHLGLKKTGDKIRSQFFLARFTTRCKITLFSMWSVSKNFPKRKSYKGTIGANASNLNAFLKGRD